MQAQASPSLRLVRTKLPASDSDVVELWPGKSQSPPSPPLLTHGSSSAQKIPLERTYTLPNLLVSTSLLVRSTIVARWVMAVTTTTTTTTTEGNDSAHSLESAQTRLQGRQSFVAAAAAVAAVYVREHARRRRQQQQLTTTTINHHKHGTHRREHTGWCGRQFSSSSSSSMVWHDTATAAAAAWRRVFLPAAGRP